MASAKGRFSSGSETAGRVVLAATLAPAEVMPGKALVLNELLAARAEVPSSPTKASVRRIDMVMTESDHVHPSKSEIRLNFV